MTAYEMEVLTSLSTTSSTPTKEKDEEYSIPIDISDILKICREYTKLNWKIQAQVEDILELGVEEAICSGSVQRESLPYIKDFLHRICDNPYFGDAVSQATDCIELILQYEEKHSLKQVSNLN